MLICWRLFASDHCASHTPDPVGAGLPAMASGQALSMSRLPASSLASQLPQGLSTFCRDWPTIRPPSPAGWLPQKSKTSNTPPRSAPPPLHRMSVGSAAAIDLNGPSAGFVPGFIRGETSRGGAAKQTGGDAPDGSRSEGTPSSSERAERQGKAFWVTFSAFGKGDPP
ncbi:hypothetical protein PS898_04755 [Pseudomonas fluorescens]|nr:hypothetical protein PS898_04755 [Pseudomonas fluorescens]